MENTEEDLKDKVKRLREEAGLSQVGLSTLAGISSQTVKDIEAGRTEGGLKSIVLITRALGTTVEALLGAEKIEVKKQPKFRVKKITKMFEAIPDEIYELAVKVDPSSRVWEGIAGTLSAEIKSQEAKSKKEKQA